jgi:hypothetical protein
VSNRRHCEFEIVSPPKICGKPAVFVTQSLYLCRDHGERFNKRWPGSAKPITKKQGKEGA